MLPSIRLVKDCHWSLEGPTVSGIVQRNQARPLINLVRVVVFIPRPSFSAFVILSLAILSLSSTLPGLPRLHQRDAWALSLGALTASTWIDLSKDYATSKSFRVQLVRTPHLSGVRWILTLVPVVQLIVVEFRALPLKPARNLPRLQASEEGSGECLAGVWISASLAEDPLQDGYLLGGLALGAWAAGFGCQPVMVVSFLWAKLQLVCSSSS